MIAHSGAGYRGTDPWLFNHHASLFEISVEYVSDVPRGPCQLRQSPRIITRLSCGWPIALPVWLAGTIGGTLVGASRCVSTAADIGRSRNPCPTRQHQVRQQRGECAPYAKGNLGGRPTSGRLWGTKWVRQRRVNRLGAGIKRRMTIASLEPGFLSRGDEPVSRPLHLILRHPSGERERGTANMQNEVVPKRRSHWLCRVRCL
jgi:hypothetical protein